MNPWGVDKAPLVEFARSVIKVPPKKVNGKCSCIEVDGKRKRTQGRWCQETHFFGMGGENDWSGSAPLEGERYSLYADWDIHGKRYIRVWAYYPRILASGVSVDISTELGQG